MIIESFQGIRRYPTFICTMPMNNHSDFIQIGEILGISRGEPAVCFVGDDALPGCIYEDTFYPDDHELRSVLNPYILTGTLRTIGSSTLYVMRHFP